MNPDIRRKLKHFILSSAAAFILLALGCSAIGPEPSADTVSADDLGIATPVFPPLLSDPLDADQEVTPLGFASRLAPVPTLTSANDPGTDAENSPTPIPSPTPLPGTSAQLAATSIAATPIPTSSSTAPTPTPAPVSFLASPSPVPSGEVSVPLQVMLHEPCAPDRTDALWLDITESLVSISGETTIYVCSSAPDTGISGFDLTISIEDGAIAEFTSAQFSKSFALHEHSALPDSEVRIRAVSFVDITVEDGFGVLFATLTVVARDSGETQLSISVKALDDDNGSHIQHTISGASLVVVDEG